MLTPRLHGKGRIPVGLQLYSIREDCQKDLPSCLAAVTKLGYDGIEFAGYYDRSATDLRKILVDLNLKAFSTHINMKTLLGGELEKTVEFNQILGNSRLTVLSLPAASSIQDWYGSARQFNGISEKLKQYDMRVGFHNLTHSPSTASIPSITSSATRGRVRMMHCKDHPPCDRYVLLGDGTIEWKPLFQAAESVGGIECYIIEQERYSAPLTPMQCAERCLRNFEKLHG